MSPRSTPSAAIQAIGSSSSSIHSRPHHSFPRPETAHNSTSNPRPMAIPNAREVPPPPLPPPRRIGSIDNGEDLGWRYGNSVQHDMNSSSTYGVVKQGSSLLGRVHPEQDYYGHHDRRELREGNTIAAMSSPIDPEVQGADGLEHSDEDRNNFIRPNFRFHSEVERHLPQKALHNSAQAYDQQLLSKIGGPHAGKRRSNQSYLSSIESSQNQGNMNNKLVGPLKPLSVPDHRYPSLDSSLSLWQSAPSSGLSPSSGVRSPLFEQNSIDSAFPPRFNAASTPDVFDDPTPGQRSHRHGSDPNVFMDPEFANMEEHGVRELNLYDRSPSAGETEPLEFKGRKRRASPPLIDGLREDRASGSGNDLYYRRSIQMLANRNSPVARPSQHPGSLSSTTSNGPRTGSSYTSTQGCNLSMASSATSFAGGERLSPGAFSSSVEAEFAPISPYAVSNNVSRSPRGSTSKLPHHRKRSEQLSDNKMQKPAERRTQSNQKRSPKIQGFLVCECCPKKPKKFDSQEELRLHELEKQYQCQYCPNRFKNKNEAERHQNSLHLRRHSWSCAALGNVQAAFHPSSNHPNMADVCGYCGEEFPAPADWELRTEHLCQAHKFGECNQAKKFFRADHFRQHLKHSHTGTSGKWTNMLENACMKDEPLPQPLNRGLGSASASMAGPCGVTGAGSGPYPKIINEVQDEL